jgi:two-component system, sensor histidine kinase and response regulator
MALFTQYNNDVERQELRETSNGVSFDDSFRLLFEANPQPMWVFNRNALCFLEVNQAALKLYGYSRDEFMSMKATDLRPAEEITRFVEYVNQDRYGLEDAGEWTHRTRDGRHLCLSITACRLTFAGKKAYLVAAQDITEHKMIEAERELQASLLEQAVLDRTAELRRAKEYVEAILNSVGEAVIVVGRDGRIHQVNAAFERHTGFLYHEVELLDHRSVLGNESNAEAFHGAVAAMRAGQTWYGELPVLRKDGTTFDAAVTITPMHDEHGEIVAYVGALADVTLIKEVTRMKDAFISNVSHELRTPITSIKLNLQLLQLDPARRAVCEERLEHEITRLNNIIDGLLQLSRLDQGRLLPNLSTVDLNALVTQYADDRTPLADSQGLTMDLNLIPNSLYVSADSGLLGQVLSILLTNALNYTPGGGKVSIETLARETEAVQWIGFSVSDTGSGITQEELPHLFERFYRGRAAHGSKVSGTGLGLAIAKEIVGLHGGTIEVFSQGIVGDGAKFTVWLPAINAAQS